MDRKSRDLLQAFYKPYNDELAALLNDERFIWETLPSISSLSKPASNSNIAMQGQEANVPSNNPSVADPDHTSSNHGSVAQNVGTASLTSANAGLTAQGQVLLLH